MTQQLQRCEIGNETWRTSDLLDECTIPLQGGLTPEFAMREFVPAVLGASSSKPPPAWMVGCRMAGVSRFGVRRMNALFVSELTGAVFSKTLWVHTARFVAGRCRHRHHVEDVLLRVKCA